MDLSEGQQATLSALDQFDECTTADEVAQVLREKGIKGDPMIACSCPLANFLDQETGDMVHFVTTTTIDRGMDWSTAIPEPLRQFVLAFDRNGYPDLITRSDA